MSEPPANTPETVKADRFAANSWGRALVGLTIALTSLAGAGAGLLAYLASRPVDLRLETQLRTHYLESLLAEHHIDDGRIAKSTTHERDEGARWTHTAFDVQLPPMLTVPGVADLVERRMGERKNDIYVESGPDDRIRIRISIGHRAFADLTLVPDPSKDVAALPEPGPMQVVVDQPHSITLDPIGAPVYSPDANRDVQPDALPIKPQPDAPALTLDSEEVARILERVEGYQEESRKLALEALQRSRDRTGFIGPSDRVFARAPAPFETRRQLLLRPARAAIIVDDGGYGGESTDRILSLSPKLTVAILPNTPFATETAEAAARLGFEVILHMPMESVNADVSHPGMIRTDMTRERIAELTIAALDQIPQAIGVNNHTGSKFTSDPEALGPFFDTIRQRGVFFVDSLTIAESRAYFLAKELRIPTAVRDVFLDNERDEAYISGKFDELIKVAKTRGTAVGICHFRPVTARILHDMLARMEREGVELVHVSDLLR